MTEYSLASSTWDDEELSAIQQVVESGRFSMGEQVAGFERAFANYVGSKHCVMVNSGSSANLLMIAALFYRESDRLVEGDEIIVPAVSWSTTYYPLLQYGLKLKFVDIDAETLNYDLEALEGAVTENTRLLMAVNLLGNPNDYDEINRIVGDRSIVIVEDNCESMGATFKGKQAGTFGVMGTFSTFFSHHMSTMEGGMIVTDDEELQQILFSLRSHGWTRGLPKVNHVCDELSSDAFYESFRFVLPGFNVRPLEMSGAIGQRQLEKLPSFIYARRKNAKLFTELFSSHPHISVQREIGESSWFGFAIVVKNDAPFTRATLVEVLTRQGIECRPIVAGNFTRNDVIKWFNYEIHGNLKNADMVHDRGLFVGNHQFELGSQLHELKEALDAIV